MPGTVLIVDDHPAFRAAARRLLQTWGYEVIGEAADGASCVEAARRLRPYLVLLDVQLPDEDGCEVCRKLTAERDPPTVVLISSRAAADYGPRINTCGARGFLEKAELTAAALRAVV